MKGPRRIVRFVLLAALQLVTGASISDDVIDSIPDLVFSPEESRDEESKIGNQRIAFQWLLRSEGWRDYDSFVVPLSRTFDHNWSTRFYLGYLNRYQFENGWRATIDLTAYFRILEGEPIKSKQSSRLDLKEAYLSKALDKETYIDLGRVNLRQGIAFGYNPTDYFKINAVRDNSSLSARERRDNRLGSVMLRVEQLWARGGLSLAIAPDLTQSTDGLWGSGKFYGLAVNQTNDRWRSLIRWNQTWIDGSQPEVSLYYDREVTYLGLSMSHGIGDAWIVYGEWSGFKAHSLAHQAIVELQTREYLTPELETFVTEDTGFTQQLAIGFSYSSENNITTTFEYHYSGWGLSDAELQQWFRLGESTSDSQVHSQLWSIRAFAQRQESLLGQHYIYLRSQMNDVETDLDLNLLVNFNIKDSSFLTQLGAVYSLNGQSRIDGYYRRFVGDSRSEYGSLPKKWSIGLSFNLFF